MNCKKVMKKVIAYGYDFKLNGLEATDLILTPGHSLSQLTGYLQDGTPINNRLVIHGSSKIELVVIPEPATLLLFGLWWTFNQEKKMKKLTVMLTVVLACGVVPAEIIRDGIDIDFVTIGNAGNLGDTRAKANPSGAGAVDYTYQIGKYEVTNGQWNAFVSAAGAPSGNPTNAYDESAHFTGTDVPTNEVSWLEAAQFCNYLTSGDKSQGAYQWSGDNSNSGDFLGIDRVAAISTYGMIYVIPTEDEWYKAAYYTGSGYSLYANGTDVAPIAGDDTNYDNVIGQPWAVGTGTMEQNGTFDMMGNVWEWNETWADASNCGIRGGMYRYILDIRSLESSYRNHYGPSTEINYMGFRVASVPEPCTLVLLSLGGLILRRKR